MRSYGYRKSLQLFSPRNTCTFTEHTKSRLISSWIFPLVQADFIGLWQKISTKFTSLALSIFFFNKFSVVFILLIKHRPSGDSTSYHQPFITLYFLLRYLRSIENILLTSLTPLEEPNRSTAKERKCKLKQTFLIGQVSYDTIIFCL